MEVYIILAIIGLAFLMGGAIVLSKIIDNIKKFDEQMNDRMVNYSGFINTVHKGKK